MITISGSPRDIEQALLGLRADAVSARKRVEDARRWRDCASAYRGKLLSKNPPLPQWRSKFDSSILYEVVERYVPVLTDQKPRLEAVAQETMAPHDEQMASHIRSGTIREWDDEDMQLLIPAMLRDVLIYGTGHAYVRVLPGDITQEKRIVTEVPSPWSIFPAPSAHFEQTPDYLWCRHRVTEADLYQTFGDDMAEKIVKEARATQTSDEFYEDDEQIVRDNEFLITLSGTSSSISAGMGHSDVSHALGSRSSHEPRYDLWVGYFHDGSMIEREITLQDGTPEKVPVRGYPFGRIIIMVGTKYFAELDAPNTLPHRRMPILRMGCRDLRGSWWGRSIIEPLLDDAEKIAMIDNRIMDCIALTLNPVVVVDDNSKVDMETIYTYPGLVIPKTPGSTIEFRPPPPLPSYVFEMRRNLMSQFDRSAGITDISRGNIPTLEDVSGRALEIATEPTYTIIRGIQRNLEKFVTEWGRIVVPLLVHPAVRSEEWWRKIIGQEIDPMTGELMPLGWEGLDPEDVAWLPDLRMTVGSSLPQNHQARFNESLSLYNAQAFGPPGSPGAAGELLKNIEHPDRESIVSRLTQEAQAMQTAMQQGAVPPGGGGPPPPEPDQGMGQPPPPNRFENIFQGVNA